MAAHFINGEFIWISNDKVAFHWKIPASSESARSIIFGFRRLDVDRLIFGDGIHNFADKL